MPPSAAVEELAAAQAQEREDVLEVGCGTGRGAEGRRIDRATARGEEDEARETAADLEAARADVLVHPDKWMAFIEQNVLVSELLDTVLNAIERKLPLLILDQLTGIKHYVQVQ